MPHIDNENQSQSKI